MASHDYSEKFLDCTMREPFFAPEMELYDRIGKHLSEQEVKLLIFLLGDALDEKLKHCIRNGLDLLVAMENSGINDEALLLRLVALFKTLHRHDIIPQVHVRDEPIVVIDPLEEYYKHSTEDKKESNTGCGKRKGSCQNQEMDEAGPSSKRFRNSELEPQREMPGHKSNFTDDNEAPWGITKKVTCDVRLRVKAEFCNHDNALRGSVNSNKQDRLERQFELFSQANTILKARDLGYIVCDIKFSEITYLDAFWRDYLNGTLLEALKGVFITETLKQAVGNEAIKLLVHVDEEDYEKGRHILLQNLQL